MPKRDTHLLLEDMLLACERIMKYVNSMNYDNFLNDTKTVDAVVRNIQILREAVAKRRRACPS